MNPNDPAGASEFRERFALIQKEISKSIAGQEDIVQAVLVAMVSGGHVLLEGVPGLGKTLMVRAIAGAVDLRFQRIQFTPDLMPADLVGTNILVEEGGHHPRFEFAPGPVFCNILLGDEINRATPKTQSALLEAMQESAVTVAGKTRPLTPPFFVLATQNPLEMDGTYPLPEAQLDRFFFKLRVPFPDLPTFEEILLRTTEPTRPDLGRVCGAGELLEMAAFARAVPVAPEIRARAAAIVMSTHPDSPEAGPEVKRYVRHGASPRAGQAILLAAKVAALLAGRPHVATDDLYAYALPALRHRVLLNFEAQADGVDTDRLLAPLLSR